MTMRFLMPASVSKIPVTSRALCCDTTPSVTQVLKFCVQMLDYVVNHYLLQLVLSSIAGPNCGSVNMAQDDAYDHCLLSFRSLVSERSSVTATVSVHGCRNVFHMRQPGCRNRFQRNHAHRTSRAAIRAFDMLRQGCLPVVSASDTSSRLPAGSCACRRPDQYLHRFCRRVDACGNIQPTRKQSRSFRATSRPGDKH